MSKWLIEIGTNRRELILLFQDIDYIAACCAFILGLWFMLESILPSPEGKNRRLMDRLITFSCGVGLVGVAYMIYKHTSKYGK